MPEKRYIDANALLKYLENEIDERNWRINQFDAGWIYSFIDCAETEDVVSTVKCKDCKFWGEEEFANGGLRICCCDDKDYATNEPSKKFAYFPVTKAIDFCSYGERKDEK